MYPLNEFRDCLERISQIFRSQRIGFCLTGGAAFVAYGDPRTTQDVDIVVDVNAIVQRLSTLIEECRREQFLLSEAAIREAVRTRRQFQLIDSVSTLKLDLYPRELIVGAIGRSVNVEILPGFRMPIASRADIVASKLVWISKGSHKSRRDVRQLMLGATEDEARMAREFAEELGQTELLAEVLAEPDEIDT